MVIPVQGDVVLVRDALWIVQEVGLDVGVPLVLAPMQRVGQPLHVLWQVEHGQILANEVERWQDSAGALSSLTAWHWASLARNCTSVYQTALASGFHAEPYQIHPLLIASRQERTRLLLCDDAGMGKTVMACLIAKHAWQRSVQRVVVACPADLQSIWVAHLARCGIQATVFGMAQVRAMREKVTIQPWLDSACTVFDIRLLLQPDVIDALHGAVQALGSGLLIVDEAHQLMNSLTPQNREAWHDILDVHEHRVFTTATPMHGKRGRTTFRQVGALLDPDDCRGTAEHMAIIVRNKRDIVREDGGSMWEPVQVRGIRHEASSAETHFDTHVDDWCRVCTSALVASDVKRTLQWAEEQVAHVRWAWQSSIAACITATENLFAATTPLGALVQTNRHVEQSTAAFLEQGRALRQNVSQHSKWQQLRDMLAATSDNMVVCTGDIATWHYLTALLDDEGIAWSGIHSSMPHSLRSRAVVEWVRPTSERRIFVTTDDALEGLSLHHQCHWLCMFDIPDDIALVDLRVSRIDRYGQLHTPVIWVWEAASGDTEQKQHLLANIVRQRIEQSSMFDRNDQHNAQVQDVLSHQQILSGGYSTEPQMIVPSLGSYDDAAIRHALRHEAAQLGYEGNVGIAVMQHCLIHNGLPAAHQQAEFTWQARLPHAWQVNPTSCGLYTSLPDSLWQSGIEQIHPHHRIIRVGSASLQQSWYANHGRCSMYAHDGGPAAWVCWWIALVATASDGTTSSHVLPCVLHYSQGTWQEMPDNVLPWQLQTEPSNDRPWSAFAASIDDAMRISMARTTALSQDMQRAWQGEADLALAYSNMVGRRAIPLSTQAVQGSMFPDAVASQAASSTRTADQDRARLVYWQSVADMLQSRATGFQDVMRQDSTWHIIPLGAVASARRKKV